MALRVAADYNDPKSCQIDTAAACSRRELSTLRRRAGQGWAAGLVLPCLVRPRLCCHLQTWAEQGDSKVVLVDGTQSTSPSMQHCVWTWSSGSSTAGPPPSLVTLTSVTSPDTLARWRVAGGRGAASTHRIYHVTCQPGHPSHAGHAWGRWRPNCR